MSQCVVVVVVCVIGLLANVAIVGVAVKHKECGQAGIHVYTLVRVSDVGATTVYLGPRIRCRLSARLHLARIGQKGV